MLNILICHQFWSYFGWYYQLQIATTITPLPNTWSINFTACFLQRLFMQLPLWGGDQRCAHNTSKDSAKKNNLQDIRLLLEDISKILWTRTFPVFAVLHSEGTSKKSDICGNIKEFWQRFYNGHPWGSSFLTFWSVQRKQQYFAEKW